MESASYSKGPSGFFSLGLDEKTCFSCFLLTRQCPYCSVMFFFLFLTFSVSWKMELSVKICRCQIRKENRCPSAENHKSSSFLEKNIVIISTKVRMSLAFFNFLFYSLTMVNWMIWKLSLQWLFNRQWLLNVLLFVFSPGSVLHKTIVLP